MRSRNVAAARPDEIVGIYTTGRRSELPAFAVAREAVDGRDVGLAVILRRPFVPPHGTVAVNLDPVVVAHEFEMDGRRKVRELAELSVPGRRYSVSIVSRPCLLRVWSVAMREGCTTLVVPGRAWGPFRWWCRLRAKRLGVDLVFANRDRRRAPAPASSGRLAQGDEAIDGFVQGVVQ
jgi:hypothetical protein